MKKWRGVPKRIHSLDLKVKCNVLTLEKRAGMQHGWIFSWGRVLFKVAAWKHGMKIQRRVNHMGDHSTQGLLIKKRPSNYLSLQSQQSLFLPYGAEWVSPRRVQGEDRSLSALHISWRLLLSGKSFMQNSTTVILGIFGLTNIGH